MKVNILQAKNQLSRLIRAAQAGEDVIIANRGKPAVRLVPVEQDAANETEALKPGDPRLIAKWFEENRDRPWSGRTREEIDAYLEEERNSWE